MSDAVKPGSGATVLPLRASQPTQMVAMARTLELYSKSFPTRHRLLMLLETWLFAAERDGVSERQPGYAEALKRAIHTLETSPTVDDAIARLRSQEASLWASSPQRRQSSTSRFR